jgi:dolichol-phosphate mannosyltransferase
MSQDELCVVVPTLNERDNIGKLLEKLAVALRGIPYEVVVVDDDSTDGTATVVQMLARSHAAPVRAIHRIGRRGLASACIEGMLSTSATYISIIDADLQHDEQVLPEMYRLIAEQGLDLVVASRNIGTGSMGDFARWRVKLSTLGRKLSRVERNAALSDPMSGFFIIRRSFFEGLAHRLTGIGFKILLDIVLSASEPVRFAEVPYRFRLRNAGQSKLDVMVGLEYLELLLDKIMGDYISVRFALFAIVGAVGVLIHLLLLHSLLHLFHEPFLRGQAIATFVVMIVNYALNNKFTYRDRRLKGNAFWFGMFTFCLACSFGFIANLAISDEAFVRGVPWFIAAVSGLLFSSVWNYGVTSVCTWRHQRRSAARRAESRAIAVSNLLGGH